MQTGDETKTAQSDLKVTAAGPGSTGEGEPGGDAALTGSRLTRLAVNLGPEAADVLKEYASRKGVSVTEAVRRAIAVLAFVDETQRRGASINVEENGVTKEVMFMA
jgi:hypothetical protein